MAWKIVIVYFFIALLCVFPPLSLAGVSNTKHNLSVSGPGTIKAVTETQVCIFCHTPHNANPAYPLWGHEISSFQNYTNYWSPTLKAYESEATAPPIDGFSKLCLSCHDGTVALGAITGSLHGTIDMVTIPSTVERGFLRPGASGYLGTDLSGGHPISFVFDVSLVIRRNQDPGLMHLKWPIIDDDVKLYPTQGGQGVQCTSCHDPHGGYPGANKPPLWRKSTHDEVCLVCHDLVAPLSGH